MEVMVKETCVCFIKYLMNDPHLVHLARFHRNHQRTMLPETVTIINSSFRS